MNMLPRRRKSHGSFTRVSLLLTRGYKYFTPIGVEFQDQSIKQCKQFFELDIGIEFYGNFPVSIHPDLLS